MTQADNPQSTAKSSPVTSSATADPRNAASSSTDASSHSAASVESTASDSARLTQFQTEVGKLGITGGKANLERRYMRLGIFVAIVGLVLTVAAYFAADSSEDFQDQIDMVIFAIFGVGLIILGGIFMAVNSITRFLRYWLVRLIYEIREQTDRITDN